MPDIKNTRSVIKDMIDKIDALLPSEQKKEFDDIREWANGGEYKTSKKEEKNEEK